MLVLLCDLKGSFPVSVPSRHLQSCAEFLYYLSHILLTLYRTNTWVVKKFLELSHIEITVLPVKERGQRQQAYTMHRHGHEVEVCCQFLLQCLKLNSGHSTSSGKQGQHIVETVLSPSAIYGNETLKNSTVYNWYNHL